MPDSRSSSLPLLQIRTLEGVRHTQLLPAPAAVVPAPAPPYPPKSLIRYGHGDRRSGVSLATSQPRPGPALRRFACLPTCPLALASRPSLVVAGLDCASSQWPRHANIKCARAHPHQCPPLHGVGRDAMARRRIGCLQINQQFLQISAERKGSRIVAPNLHSCATMAVCNCAVVWSRRRARQGARAGSHWARLWGDDPSLAV